MILVWKAANRPPEKQGRYLVWCSELEGNIDAVSFDPEKGWADGDPDWDDVTHWAVVEPPTDKGMEIE